MNLLEKVKSAGVVGAGGAGFPTHAKYTGEVEYVIANAAECEPLLFVDQQMISRYADDFLEGMNLIMQQVKARRGYIGIKKKYKEAIHILEEKLHRYPAIHLHLMNNFYPAGDEFVLVYDVLKRTIPEGGLPLHVGAVVNNVLTMINVARASRGIPVTSRPLTVGGEVRNPSTFSVPLGITYREAIELAGGPAIPDAALIVGGPMMGSLESNWDKPVTKTTGGLLLLPPDNYLVLRKRESEQSAVRRGRSTCDQCMYCTEFCPRNVIGHNLRPHKSAMRAAPYGISEEKLVTSAWLCSECKLCDYFSCPLFLSPGKIHGYLKREMAASGIKNTLNRRQDTEAMPHAETRRVPVTRLVNRLQLDRYNHLAPLVDIDYRPQEVRIPLRQHIGAPAVPVVKIGDTVRIGDLIGEIPENSLGARVHASMDGVVKEIGNEILIKKF